MYPTVSENTSISDTLQEEKNDEIKPLSSIKTPAINPEYFNYFVKNEKMDRNSEEFNEFLEFVGKVLNIN